MTRRMRQLRAYREQWTPRHLCHLSSGQDWRFIPGEGWGDLYAMDDDRLLDTISDMEQCWQSHQPFPSSEALGMNADDNPPWFAEYAGLDGNRALFLEIRKANAYSAYQTAHNGYRPYAEFEAQYVAPID